MQEVAERKTPLEIRTPFRSVSQVRKFRTHKEARSGGIRVTLHMQEIKDKVAEIPRPFCKALLEAVVLAVQGANLLIKGFHMPEDRKNPIFSLRIQTFS